MTDENQTAIDGQPLRRNWNVFLWVGFGIAVAAFLSYFLFFVLFPATRDFPWVNLLLFIFAASLLGAGLRRAYGEPERYRGKISGVILIVLSVAVFGAFFYFTFVLAKELPPANEARQAGQQAPDFTLSDANGKSVTLSEMLKTNRAVLLIFYRGYW